VFNRFGELARGQAPTRTDLERLLQGGDFVRTVGSGEVNSSQIEPQSRQERKSDGRFVGPEQCFVQLSHIGELLNNHGPGLPEVWPLFESQTKRVKQLVGA